MGAPYHYPLSEVESPIFDGTPEGRIAQLHRIVHYLDHEFYRLHSEIKRSEVKRALGKVSRQLVTLQSSENQLDSKDGTQGIQ